MTSPAPHPTPTPAPIATRIQVPVDPPRLAHWEIILELALERMGDTAWICFAARCQRLLAVPSLDGDLAADGYSLDSAYHAYRAGLTPAHYAYATGLMGGRIAQRLEGPTVSPAPPAPCGEDDARDGVSSPLLFRRAAEPPASVLPPRANVVATASAACVSAMATTAVTVLLLVHAPAVPEGPLLGHAWAGSSDIPKSAPPPACARPEPLP
jgi:hypothetical protein